MTRSHAGLASTGEPIKFDMSPGPRIYNLFPLLSGTVSDWRAELPRIAGMGFDWVYLNPFHAAGFSGSIYATKDPYHLDPRFRDDSGESDEHQVKGFCAAAAEAGLKVMADLVINHTSKDALLVEMRPDVYRRDEAGELESPYAIDPVDPSVRTVWGDLAELDYANEGAREFLIPYWHDYVEHMQDLGIKGFRCDAAYKVPAEVWQRLIGAARERDADVVFVAETLGCTFDETRAVAEAGFDYLFNSFAWWDGASSWALEHYSQLRALAPSIAFPENHDTARLAADFDPEDRERIARQLKLRYALSAMFSSGVLMPVGYERGYRKPLHVVETTPADREDTGIDISPFVAAINRLRADLPPCNTEGAQMRLNAPDAPYLALLRLDAAHSLDARYATLVVANPSEREVEVSAEALLSRTSGEFGRFSDMTPGAEPDPFAPGITLVLQPGEVRIFAAARAVPMESEGEAAPDPAGRVVIQNVTPVIDNGTAPAKRVVGEAARVSADIFTDGHDTLAAEILFRAADERDWRRAPMRLLGNDRWEGCFPIERNTRYVFTLEAWRDTYLSWRDEIEKKRNAGQDVRLETIEGVALAERCDKRRCDDGKALTKLLAKLKKEDAGSSAQLDLLLAPENAELLKASAERRHLQRYERELEIIGDRLAARFSAWYELFPRSMSDNAHRHGTFDDVIRKLPYVHGMGFDVLYFPPIHPVGTVNRKGKNNSLTPGENDPGSVYAIGNEHGGHETVDPELGTLEDFRRLVAAAHEHGLEIALDFAIQCSPDHPWIKEHPGWFDWRPDGTLKYAENPPKKYEDIVNVDFDQGYPDLWLALRDAVLFWVGEGVRIFRVDNPHTKPLPFWKWMIADINRRYPEVLFLAEAFTRPAMMRQLAKAGFQQSYTYFTWRNTKGELMDYARELAGEMGDYYRPNFFANTPDINPYYLQTSGRAGFIVRSTLAATLSSNWGIYSGFELCEATPLPGREEYLDSEKYEIKAWDWDRPGHIREHIRALNTIRRENPALADFRNVLFLNAWNDNILAFAKFTPERDNCVLVLVNLDPRNRQECSFEIPLWEFGLPDEASIAAHDLLGDQGFRLHGKVQRIALDPVERPVAIWRLIPPT